MGRFMEAMVVCKKGMKAHPNLPSPRVLLARVYLGQGKDKKALEEAVAALQIAPADKATLRFVGDLQLKTGEADAGKANLLKAFDADPSDAETQARARPVEARAARSRSRPSLRPSGSRSRLPAPAAPAGVPMAGPGARQIETVAPMRARVPNVGPPVITPGPGTAAPAPARTMSSGGMPAARAAAGSGPRLPGRTARPAPGRAAAAALRDRRRGRGRRRRPPVAPQGRRQPALEGDVPRHRAAAPAADRRVLRLRHLQREEAARGEPAAEDRDRRAQARQLRVVREGDRRRRGRARQGSEQHRRPRLPRLRVHDSVRRARPRQRARHGPAAHPGGGVGRSERGLQLLPLRRAGAAEGVRQEDPRGGEGPRGPRRPVRGAGEEERHALPHARDAPDERRRPREGAREPAGGAGQVSRRPAHLRRARQPLPAPGRELARGGELRPGAPLREGPPRLAARRLDAPAREGRPELRPGGARAEPAAQGRDPAVAAPGRDGPDGARAAHLAREPGRARP